MSKTDIVAILVIIASAVLMYFEILDFSIWCLIIALMAVEIPKRDTQRKVEKAIKNSKNPKDVSRFVR